MTYQQMLDQIFTNLTFNKKKSQLHYCGDVPPLTNRKTNETDNLNWVILAPWCSCALWVLLQLLRVSPLSTTFHLNTGHGKGEYHSQAQSYTDSFLNQTMQSYSGSFIRHTSQIIKKSQDSSILYPGYMAQKTLAVIWDDFIEDVENSSNILLERS